MRFLYILTLALPCWILSPAIAADSPLNIAGMWRQIDDKTGKLRSQIRIVETAPGQYEGFVEKIVLAPHEPANPVCEKCKDARKNQPIMGMRIITGLKRAGNNSFGDGEILDPDNGEVYRLKITVLDQGKKLDVRGFIGFALFGRSQIWLIDSAQDIKAEVR